MRVTSYDKAVRATGGLNFWAGWGFSAGVCAWRWPDGNLENGHRHGRVARLLVHSFLFFQSSLSWCASVVFSELRGGKIVLDRTYKSLKHSIGAGFEKESLLFTCVWNIKLSSSLPDFSQSLVGQGSVMIS